MDLFLSLSVNVQRICTFQQNIASIVRNLTMIVPKVSNEVEIKFDQQLNGYVGVKINLVILAGNKDS